VLVKLLILTAHAQNFSTRGTDFWAGYAPHISMYSTENGSVTDTSHQNMRLYFSAVKRSKSNGGNTRHRMEKRNYIVAANSIAVSDTLPKNGIYDSRIAKEGVFKRGIHIFSDEPIAAWCHEYDSTISGASLLIPTIMMGEDYRVLGFYQDSKEQYAHAFCFAIATEDSTWVEVTPSQNTLTHSKGIPFTQMLMKGEVLNLLGEKQSLLQMALAILAKTLQAQELEQLTAVIPAKGWQFFVVALKLP